MSKLTNKRVLITGASSGIGETIATTFAKEGAIVAFSYHENEKGAKKTLAALEASTDRGYMLKANLAEISNVQALFQEAIEVMGGLDILINNAGTLTRHAHFLDIPLNEFEHIQEVNLRAPFILTQLAGKYMRDQNIRGSIINISSQSAVIVSQGLTHYECSKAGLNALTRAAASALAPYGIRVNAISPGLVETEINKAQRESQPSLWQKRASCIPLQRTGKSEDIASLALFLASEDSSWMTGSIIPVDGGVGIHAI